MTDLSPEAKRLFEASQAALEPDPARLARVSDALAKRLASAGSEAGAVGFLRSLGTVRWVGIGIVLMAAGAFVAVGRQGDETRASAPRTSAEAAPQVVDGTAAMSAALKASSPRATLADDARVDRWVSEAPQPASEAPKLRAAAKEAVAPQPRVARKAAAFSPPVHRSARSEARATPTSLPELEAAAELAPATAALSEPESAVRKPAPQTLNAPDDTALANELTLMRGARTALDHNDAGRTLDLLAQHASHFPRGTLYQERLALQVLALCALGRADEAVAASSMLEAAAPRSPHWMRINDACKSTRRATRPQP